MYVCIQTANFIYICSAKYIFANGLTIASKLLIVYTIIHCYLRKHPMVLSGMYKIVYIHVLGFTQIYFASQ